jgi:2-hydroxy-4-carboxymuconate semialdehyde hemiacetal dehydrogenase
MVAADLNVALVGPGAIGERHLFSLRAAGARVSAVVSGAPAEAEAFAAQYDVPTASAELDAVLGRDDVDAVVIASPSPLHAGQLRSALLAGKPTLCEIPFALGLTEAMELADLADRQRLQATVAHTFRYAAPYREIRDRIEQGTFQTRHVVGHQLSLRHDNIGWTGRQRDWVDDVLWHHGGHLFDTALWFLDATDVEVTGRVGPEWPGNGTYMDVAAVLVAPDGDLASLALSYHSRASFGNLMIIGEDQTFEIRGGTLNLNGEPIVECADWEDMMRSAQAAQDLEFLDSIRQGRQPLFNLRDAIPTMRVLDALAPKP